jgi:monoamine oxidase
MSTSSARDADVLVLGAGLAGLTAASELTQRGASVRVIEARARVGGRAWTLRDPGAPIPIELGAELVHGDAPLTQALARDAGLVLVEGSSTHWRRVRGVVRESAELERALSTAFPKCARIVRRYGDRSFAQALEEARVREPARSLALAYVEGFQAAHADRISARSTTGDELGLEGVRRILSGHDRLVDALRARLPRGAIHLGTIATEIRWKQREVAIACTTARGARTTFRAQRVVVAVPLGVLQARDDHALRFSPPLTSETRALEHVAMGNVVKIVLRFREPFWEDSKRRNVAFLHAIDREFPTWWTQHPVRVPLWTGWAGGSRADAPARANEAQIVDVAVKSLASALGLARARVARHLIASWRHDWIADPFSRGAYSYPLVGGANASRALAQPVDRTIFFAGEATCAPPANGTVEGAIASGRRAARQVLLALRDAR